MLRPTTNFVYQRRVGFCDTDAMGVVHHGNYLLYCEEARVAWLRHKKLMSVHYPQGSMVLAVVQSRLQHKAPLRFDDLVEIYLQVRTERLRVLFQYAIFAQGRDKLVALVETELVPLTCELKPTRVPAVLKETMENEAWTETWL